MGKEHHFLRVINTINDHVGKATAFLLIPLMLIVTLEVVLRYVFNRPTIWAWDVNVQLACAIVVMGAGYTLRHDAHVKVDVLVNRLTTRKRAIVDLITSSIFFFSVGVLVWQSWNRGIYSVQTHQVYSSYWAPPVYPLKMLIVVAAFLLLLQGIAKFIRDLAVVRSNGE